MKNNLIKIEQKYEFSNKRNLNLITPCCNKSNKNGKFVNYKELPEVYGYCHSCGKANLPPNLYKDEKGNEYIWNDLNNCFEPIVSHSYYKNVLQSHYNSVIQCDTRGANCKKAIKYIQKELVLQFLNYKPENNLLQYLRNTYNEKKVDFIKKLYYIGTSKDGGTVFWSINKKGLVQKAKVSYYKKDGKRTNYFKVPYKKEDGYYNCLFGEHLIDLPENKNKSIILVESEKTAIVCSLHLPEFIWLAYGGINGLTNNKIEILVGRKVILAPDISENAVKIMNKKLPHLIELGIYAKIWDMTEGKSDDQLKKEGWYNCDLEDVFRNFS
ncbi:DUF6371 domain-containing protein [Lutibacter sp.]|uniref:DUF6371 domain-containing protein n=1 Tax=Lutibacter sp. TaxID=1925666 RepID=UPI0035664AF7